MHVKDYARGPNKWQGERPHGDSRGGPPRRSFGAGGGGDRSWGPPRRSFGQEGDRGSWQERPRRPFNGPPAGDRGHFDRPPRRTFRAPEDGGRSDGGERADAGVVQPRALVRGVGEARQALAEVVRALASERAAGMEVEAIEAPVSFSAEGRFLGFGRGGAATLVITLTALDADDALEPPASSRDHAGASHGDSEGSDDDDISLVGEVGDAPHASGEPASQAMADDGGAEVAATAEAEPTAATSKRRRASGDKAAAKGAKAKSRRGRATAGGDSPS